MSRQTIIGTIVAVVIVSVGLLMVWNPGAGPGERASAIGLQPGNVIGVIPIEGTITAGRSGSLFNASATSDRITQLLREAREDPQMKAVVLRMNTGGGSAAASQEIATQVQRLREAGKPVVTSMADTAASGGYWIAAESSYIFASPATMTGSIGVIMQLVNMEGLFDDLGVEPVIIKGGQYKDLGSPDRPLTEEERMILEQMVDEIHQQFIRAVARGRDLSVEEVSRLATGRIFTGSQALEVGLIDELGPYEDAVKKAAELAGLESYETRPLNGNRSFLSSFLTRVETMFPNLERQWRGQAVPFGQRAVHPWLLQTLPWGVPPSK